MRVATDESLPSREAARLFAMQLTQRVVFDGGPLLVVDKPPHLPATGDDLEDPACVQGVLMEAYGQMLWAAHQLDRETSGLLVFVRKKSWVARMQARMKSAGAAKRYLALVEGQPAFERKSIRLALGPSPDAHRQAVRNDGKPARTDVKIRARGPAHALLEARLCSGRTHQIRAHLAALGHPIVGDARYGATTIAPRHALHAWVMDFTDDVEPRSLCAPWPDDLRQLADKIEVPCDSIVAPPAPFTE